MLAAAAVVAVASVAGAGSAAVAVSGAEIVFARGVGASSRLYVVSVSGRRLRQLATPQSAGEPVWSPDGKLVAFTDHFGDVSMGFAFGPTLAVISSDGSGLRKIPTPSGIAESPAWAPDGKELVYTYEPIDVGALRLRIVGADGSGDRELTSGEEGDDGQPAWSPAGTWIAFTRERSLAQLYLIRPDGSGEHRLPHRGWADTQPAWSPDGRRLAFVGYRNFKGPPVLFLVNADGRHRLDLTSRFGFRGTAPDWSADGRKLVFACAMRRVRRGLCIGDLRTGRLRVLTHGQDSHPRWQPASSSCCRTPPPRLLAARPWGRTLCPPPGQPCGPPPVPIDVVGARTPPRAGGAYAALVATRVLAIEPWQFRCFAFAGIQRLRVAIQSFTTPDDTAGGTKHRTCAVTIPTRAAGKRLFVSYTTDAGGAHESGGFSWRILR